MKHFYRMFDKDVCKWSLRTWRRSGTVAVAVIATELLYSRRRAAATPSRRGTAWRLSAGAQVRKVSEALLRVDAWSSEPPTAQVNASAHAADQCTHTDAMLAAQYRARYSGYPCNVRID